MPALRPVAADARLTLVEHLGELRTRLFVSLAILVVAFAFTYWQNNRILDVVNEPLTQSQLSIVDCDRSVDPIRSGECFDRALARALGTLRPVLEDVPTSGAAERRQVDEALTTLDRAVRQAPATADRRPVTLGVAEPFFQTVTVALYAALVITLPLLLYQLYAFLIPAFSRRERQAIVPLLLGVPLLFYTGVAFGYFFALPRAVDFLQNFNADQFDILVQAKDYYKFVLMFLAGTGLVFQIPVVVIAISRLGILTAAQMRKQRGIVAVGAAVISALITPTPDAVTMLMVMVPFLVLFELSVALASVLERRRAAQVAGAWDEDDDEDPPAGSHDPSPRPRGPAPATAVGDRHAAPGRATDDDLPPLADDWVEDTWDETADDEIADDPAPHGEDPDLRLLGDPAGPRVADDDPSTFDDDLPAPDDGPTADLDWTPDPLEGDWLARADELDDEDPYADESDDEREP